MTQQQLQQQQQTGTRLEDDLDAKRRRAAGEDSPDQITLSIQLGPEQLARIEYLNAARDLVMVVGEGGTETQVPLVDLLAVAHYIDTGSVDRQLVARAFA